MPDDQEIPLTGGRVTPGIVRIGNTVRRPVAANAALVHRLLGHLAARGFAGAPRFLGVDDRGREIFSFLDGEVPGDLGHHDDLTLWHAAALMRRLHDLSAELVAPGAAYADENNIICHNDLSPCNFVFRSGKPVAIIDFDAAAPGTRADDLGYAAWLWLDLGSDAADPTEQRRRLALFAAAYGLPDGLSLIPSILRRQQRLLVKATETGKHAMAAWARDCLDWTRQHLSPAKATG